MSPQSHIAAACGSFKSFLQHERDIESANPTARQRVDRSNPFYNTSARKQIKNPTARQRVDRSSPFYKTERDIESANPTSRQRVDRSGPF